MAANDLDTEITKVMKVRRVWIDTGQGSAGIAQSLQVLNDPREAPFGYPPAHFALVRFAWGTIKSLNYLDYKGKF
jgi:hypothetical protein